MPNFSNANFKIISIIFLWNLIFKLIAEKSEEKDKNIDPDAKRGTEQKDLPISESDTDKKVSIFNSDTDGENMHGGRTLVWKNLFNFLLPIAFIYQKR